MLNGNSSSCMGDQNKTGIDLKALHRLESRAKEAKSDAVIVYYHGRTIFEHYSKSRLDAFDLMSCTKSVAALAVCKAIDSGALSDVDQTVASFYPEWMQGHKRFITIRHLLNHTSGIQNDGTGMEVYRAPNAVQLALAAELSSIPGSKFSYNNKAVNLLSGIIQLATGVSLETYVRDHFFVPMGISEWKWRSDNAGFPYAMGDLHLKAADFAKFGNLLLQNGVWGDKKVLPSQWITHIGQQSQKFDPLCGYLWWRLPSSALGILDDARLKELRSIRGISPSLVDRLGQLSNIEVRGPIEWHRLLADTFGPDWVGLAPGLGPYGTNLPRWTFGPIDGVAAKGYLGQYLVVFPERSLVGVRQVAPFADFEFLQHRFEDFPDLVRDLVGPVA